MLWRWREDDNATLVAMEPLICEKRNALVQGRQEDTFGVTGFNCLMCFFTLISVKHRLLETMTLFLCMERLLFS